MSLTSHTLAPGQAGPQGAAFTSRRRLPRARPADRSAPQRAPAGRACRRCPSTPHLAGPRARATPPPPTCPAVPLFIGGAGLPADVKLRDDLPEAGLANVAATVFNLMGFEVGAAWGRGLFQFSSSWALSWVRKAAGARRLVAGCWRSFSGALAGMPACLPACKPTQPMPTCPPACISPMCVILPPLACRPRRTCSRLCWREAHAELAAARRQMLGLLRCDLGSPVATPFAPRGRGGQWHEPRAAPQPLASFLSKCLCPEHILNASYIFCYPCAGSILFPAFPACLCNPPWVAPLVNSSSAFLEALR